VDRSGDLSSGEIVDFRHALRRYAAEKRGIFFLSVFLELFYFFKRFFDIFATDFIQKIGIH
jgi:hypothetical protein